MHKSHKIEAPPENHPIRLVNNALYQLNEFIISDTFGKSFYDVMCTLNELQFEAGGIILDFFKSSTPLSPMLIDDFINCKLTECDRSKVLEIIFAATPSAYMDPRYVEKLRTYGYLQITDEALQEFHNVITALRRIDLQKRKVFVDKVQTKMEGLMTVEPVPVQRHYKTVLEVVKQLEGRSIVYFSPEMKLIGGPRSIFAGGLGVLAGEYVEGLADCGITTYGITLLYKKSILQRVSPYNISTTDEITIDYSKLPVFDTGVEVSLNIMGIPVRAKVWEMNAGPARIFALEDMTSDLTEMLYGGSKETHALREQQNQLLGRGGILAIEELYQRKIIHDRPGIIHLNEANCYCAVDEMLYRHMFAENIDKKGFWKDVGVAFTTHTPVPAGLPMIYSQSFTTDNIIHLSWLLNMDPATLMRFYVQYLGGRSWKDLSDNERERLITMLRQKDVNPFIEEFKKLAGTNIVINLTEATAALADGSTSVSLRHEQVSNAEIIKNSKNSPSRHGGENQATTGITNGVNIRDWQPPEFQSVDPESVPVETLLAVKRREKQEYIDMVNHRAGTRLSPEHLTISIMRRINTYKRTDLIIKEIDTLVEELGDEEINVVFSGIPHEKDQPAQEIFKRILAAVNWKHPNIHVAFICQYDITIAKYGVRGSDLWLMQPVEKKEASSTSHQKALGAATLVASTYDGAMIENVVDIEVDPKNANGVFITPLIIHRTLHKSENRIRFIHGNSNYGYYHKPVISIDGSNNFMPVAVIDRDGRYIVVDAIDPDLSPAHLRTLRDNPPAFLTESPVYATIKSVLGKKGELSNEGFHKLLYDVLDPFSTSDLHRLYDYNPQPWCKLLYKKLGLLAKCYTGVKYGLPQYGAQWVRMMRNSLMRTYEVDIHRMSAEYIRDIYDHILKRKRSTLLEHFDDSRLLEIALKWRSDFVEIKKKEFEQNMAARLTISFLDPDKGVRLEQISLSDSNNETSKSKTTVNVKINADCAIEPDDFIVELHYGNDKRTVMKIDPSTIKTDKRYTYTASVNLDAQQKKSLNVAIRPEHELISSFIEYVRYNKDNSALEETMKKDIKLIVPLLDNIDDDNRRWFRVSSELYAETENPCSK
ncbi:MAG: glycogen/starch/alpha-glucan phosphorylase [Candidatus Auribacterota bacterium]|nr:glycogen/starch/alpha-glucan phosphorylase [Candidatus Auribacterota bacterium]